MSIDANVLRALVAAGATADMIIAAVEADAASDAARKAAKRANNAERQRRFKERKRQEQQENGNAGNALPDVSNADNASGKECPPDPLKKTTNNNPPLPTGETPKGVARSRGSVLPDDWSPNEAHLAKAAEKNFPPEWVAGQADAMREWALGNRNRPIARKADWDQTFHGWIRREMERQGSRPRLIHPPPASPEQSRNNVLEILARRKATQ